MTLATLVDGGGGVRAQITQLHAYLEDGAVVWDVTLTQTLADWDALMDAPIPSVFEHARAAAWSAHQAHAGGFQARVFLGESVTIEVTPEGREGEGALVWRGTLRHVSLRARKGATQIRVSARVLLDDLNAAVDALGGQTAEIELRRAQLDLPLGGAQ